MVRAGLLLGALVAGTAMATETPAPLSAIDWLNQKSDLNLQNAALPRTREAPVTETATAPGVRVETLETRPPGALGVLPVEVTGLAPDLWQASEPPSLLAALDEAVPQRLPAGQEILLSLLLAEAAPLARATPNRTWILARVNALARLGALAPALSLINQADPAEDPALFAAYLRLSLLDYSEGEACRVLLARPALVRNPVARIFCTARTGDVETAALLFGTHAALGDLSALEEDLLLRYLDPELLAAEEVPQAPVRPDALVFRLFEVAGAPLPTAPLPLIYAQSDLRDEVGWKAQLEAAERLARASALPPERLRDLYRARSPAASGGTWDRVEAFQDSDAALAARDVAAIEATLPAAWRAMQAAGLETVFAALTHDALDGLSLRGETARIAYRIQLLGASTDRARLPAANTRRDRFLASVARGRPDPTLAETEMEQAVLRGFARTAPVSDGMHDRAPGQLGETMLEILGRLSQAGHGNTALFAQVIADLRALSLDRQARQIALEALILLDRG